ncbi:RNA-binding S4 domain-containing protein [Corynebacterium massiliense]|uniref:RNA-binding S4 domain-containing protein n=1 Tax=Corynebacterium massiliense TaxID=441501 RepID=UPI0023551B84|nr:RNA-binding S4 domain-containing protein [Corynebacterium massiliense]
MNEADVPISGESIKLGQFLKVANVVATGGEAKEIIASGELRVNGEVETRRGATLRLGDVVTLGDEAALRVAEDDADDDYFDEATADDDFDPEKWRNL